MKGGPKSSLRPFLHQDLQLFTYMLTCLWILSDDGRVCASAQTIGHLAIC